MSYNNLRNKYNLYLNQYTQQNGTQTTEQIRTLTRNYAIQERGGRYDLTAKKYYCSLFTGYLLLNRIPFPEGWHNDPYDPDNEFIGDIHVQQLKKKWDKRIDKKVKDMFSTILINDGNNN